MPLESPSSSRMSRRDFLRRAAESAAALALAGGLNALPRSAAAQDTADTASPPAESTQHQETEYPSLAGYRLPFVGKYMITQGPSINTPEGDACGPDDHPTHHDLWQHAIDFSMEVGVPIVAVQRGMVVVSENLSTLGNFIVIKHPDGLHSLYAHLDTRDVAVGSRVNSGQQIGKSGSTGTNAPHLHFSIGYPVVAPGADPDRYPWTSVPITSLPGIEMNNGPDASCDVDAQYEGKAVGPPVPMIDSIKSRLFSLMLPTPN